MSLLLFFTGLWIGGLVVVFTMCLFQVSGKCAEKEDSEHCFLNSGEGDLK